MLLKKKPKGLTLIEVMVSVALLSIVATSAVAMFFSGQTMNKMNNDKQVVYKALQEAIDQVKQNIDVTAEDTGSPFIQRNAFDVIGLNVSLKGASDADLHFDEDGEDVGSGEGTQLGRVVVESVSLQNQVVGLQASKLFRITAEVKANFRNGGAYLDERLVLFIKK
ncbi:type II secretion system protein [Candidatus Uabimicrobium sp. HlEnr_7]|uniref:type II secretion system protein n=1 Tax=Candidatus Uabimicrobium helgolandensis TaxID=3095367 RepID=UPI0035574054